MSVSAVPNSIASGPPIHQVNVNIMTAIYIFAVGKHCILTDRIEIRYRQISISGLHIGRQNKDAVNMAFYLIWMTIFGIKAVNKLESFQIVNEQSA